MELKLRKYNNLTNEFTNVLAQLNKVELTKTAKEQLDGLILTNIDPVTILDAMKFAKVSKLPNFKDYIEGGVNLAATVPHCTVTSPCLYNLQDVITGLNLGIYKHVLPGVSYSKKKDSFIINPVGEQMIDNQIIRLNKEQAKIYEMYQNIFNTIVKLDSPLYACQNLLPDFAYMSGLDGLKFLDDSVATKIKLWLK